MQKGLLIVIFIGIIIAFGVWFFTLQKEMPAIGGERDVNGCLTPAGYGFNENIGACARNFELTPDIERAAKIAVGHVGGGYALTVVSFNSYEEAGAYDITLERGVERERKIVYIRNWKIEVPETVKLFYYNPELDQDSSGNIQCSRDGLVAVPREILKTDTLIEDTIRLLLAGELTPTEASQGITTEYPLSGFSLSKSALKNGVLTLTFEDLENRTGGGSCRVGILWFQIEATVKQFPGVTSVRFLPEELFQP